MDRLPPLPAGWRVARLGDVAETALGKMLDAARPRGTLRVPYLRNLNVQWGRIDLDDVQEVLLNKDEKQRFALEPGDLLVCEGGDIGRAAIWRGCVQHMTYQKALHRVRSRGEIDLSYLRYLLEHYASTGELRRRATGSTILHLPQRQLRELPIPLPPLDEQRRIVEILEDHLSSLDAAKQIVTGAERRLLSWRKSWLDRIVRTNASSTGTLRDLVHRIEAGKSFGGSARPAREGQWGVIKVSAMTWGEFRPEENKAVSGDRVDPRYEIRLGDVLVSRANTTEYVGAPVLVVATPSRLLLSDKSLRLVPREGVNPLWLVQVLASPTTRRQISLRATGTKDSMRNISQATLLEVAVPRATPDHQERVIALAGSIDSATAATRSAVNGAKSRSAVLRRALLEAAFTGRLTGRSSDEEVAQELAGV